MKWNRVKSRKNDLHPITLKNLNIILAAHRIHRRGEISQRAAQFALRTDPDETVDEHQRQSLDTLSGAASGRVSFLFPFGKLFPGQRREPLDTIRKNHLHLPSPSL